MLTTPIIDLEWLNTFIGTLTPILVAMMGAYQLKRERSSKREKALQAKLDEKKAEEEAEEKHALAETLSVITKRIDTVGEQIQQISTQVDTIASDQGIQKNQLEKLSQITQVNLEYSRSLGNVVITMGNSLRATEMPDVEAQKVDAAISDFRDTEQTLMSRLYKAMY